MAIARLSMKVGKRGKAGPHAAYISRVGQYARYLERGEKLVATEAGNMPNWAQFNPLEFWQAADSYERENGTTYREMEIALPRELNTEQQIALVREWVRREIGGRHVYQWGIHSNTAADGGDQPHVHLMFSERQRDDIERDPEQYFKRYNGKSPERGGARKGYGANAGKTLAKQQRAGELIALRGRWADMCNAHLERAGRSQRIDMRSYTAQGVGSEPERKQLPSQWRGQGKPNVIEFRKARDGLAKASQDLVRVVPDVAGEIELQARGVVGQLAWEPKGRSVRKEVTHQAVVELLSKGAIERRCERIASIRSELNRERLRVDIMPSGWTTERGRKARDNLVKAKEAREQLARQRTVMFEAKEEWRKAHPFMAKIGWKNRIAWDLEYTLDGLPQQEAEATKLVEATERAWSAAHAADTQIWQEENEVRRQRIRTLEAELERLIPPPQREPTLESQQPDLDDAHPWLTM